jgi:hypothetical protein
MYPFLVIVVVSAAARAGTVFLDSAPHASIAAASIG